MKNIITSDRNSARADRSKYLAQCAVSNGRHMITLQEARENAMRSIKEAADAAGITVRTLRKWEENCGRAELFALTRLCIFYGASADHIFPGKATDLLEARREGSKLEKKTFEVDDLIKVLKKRGCDTTELENFVEEIRRSREVEMKNASSASTPETFNQSVM
ncbi:helix-turn-helix domain-containing protein [Paenibacillus piscarius]|uniref:helix-turn-helix domain-containing protein n=1 Tax=Paenibacillus piscarius TaxID=1089681 RepID=UPI001EE81776|nr:helix-turn-helix transcriptional regulator [Paenibacillus piscarius]